MNIRQVISIAFMLGLTIGNQGMVAKAAVITPGSATTDNLTDATNTWDINASSGASDAVVNFNGSNDELTITDSVSGSGSAELQEIEFTTGNTNNTVTIGDGINDVTLTVDIIDDNSSGNTIYIDADNAADTGNSILQIDDIQSSGLTVTLDDGTSTTAIFQDNPNESSDFTNITVDGASSGEGQMHFNSSSSNVINGASTIGGMNSLDRILIGQDGTDSVVTIRDGTISVEADNGIILGTSSGSSNDSNLLALGSNSSSANITIDSDITGSDANDSNRIFLFEEPGFDSTITINGNISSTIDSVVNEVNSLKALNSATFNGTVAASLISLKGTSDDAVNLDFNNTVSSATIDLDGNASGGEINVNFSGDVSSTFTLDEGSAGANSVDVTFDGSSSLTVSGTIDGDDDSQGNVFVTNSHSSGAIFSNTIGNTNSLRLLSVGDGAGNGGVGDFNNTVDAAAINIHAGNSGSDDASANFSNNIVGSITMSEDGSDDATLTIDGSSEQTLTGSINAGTAGDANVVINNDLIVSGNIGATRLGALTLQAGDTLTMGAANSTTSLGATTTTLNGTLNIVDQVQLVSGSTATFANNSSIAISSPSNITSGEAALDVASGSTLNIGSGGGDTVDIETDISLKEGTFVIVDDTSGGTVNINGTVSIDTTEGFTLSNYTVDVDSSEESITLTAEIQSGQEIADTIGVTTQEGESLRNVVVASLDDTVLESAIDSVFSGSTAQQQDVAEQAVGSATSTGATVEAAASTAAQVFDTVSTHLSAQRSGSRLASGGSGVSTGNNVFGTKVWSKAFGNVASQDDSPGVTGFDSHTYGMTFGADVIETDKSTFGAALSYAHTNIDANGSSKNETDMNSFQLSFYGDYNTNNFYMEGYTALAVNDITTTRNINIGSLNRTASGDYWSHQFTTKIEGGRYYTLPHNLTLTPTVGLLYSHVFNNTYTETGAGSLNLEVTPDDADVLDFSFGAKLNASYHTAKGAKLSPEIRFGASYDLAADEATATQRYQGGGSAFTVEGAKVEPLALHLGTSLDYAADRVTLSVGYDGEYREDFHSHTGYLQMQYLLQQPDN